MAKVIRYEFTVRGVGPFPIDMLRYDRCWPKDESHTSAAIGNSFHPRNFGAPWEMYLVSLNEPTEGRWESFGYKVTESKKITLV